METAGYIAAFLIGLVMGLIGSGGSILSVPVFVYLFGMNAVTATSLSLFVVGTTSAVGAIGYVRQKVIHIDKALLFGIPSIIAVISVRKYVVPAIPEVIHPGRELSISKHVLLLGLFAVLMIISAYKMIRKKSRHQTYKKGSDNIILLILQGLFVGAITGLVGAGGGFLIIPALVLITGLSMKQAVGTSLCIVAMNALTGFYSSLELVEVPWGFLLLFTAISIGGILFGIILSKRIRGEQLKPFFGWFVLLIGLYIILKEFFPF